MTENQEQSSERVSEHNVLNFNEEFSLKTDTDQ